MKQIKIACVNDFHAALQQTEATPGCARFFTAISRWKAENPGSIVVFGGDDYKGDPTSEYADGAPVTALMRQLGVQASALGNHELDYPVSQLKHWQQEGGYRFVCANLKDQETGELPDFVIPYVILRCNEIKIALIGLATQENLNTSGHPADIRKFVITDPVKATKKWCRWLKDGNDPSGIPDAVIALTHLGLQFDQENIPTGEEMCALCCADAGIDGAFAAHWHQLMATWIGSVPVAQGGSYGKGFAVLTLTFSDTGLLKSVEPSYVSLEDPNDWPEADGQMAETCEKSADVVMKKLGVVLGYAPEAIIHRDPETHEPSYYGTPLTAMTLEAMVKRAGVPVGLLYSGWLGNGLPKGEIKRFDVNKIMFYSGNIVSMYINGGELLKNLEIGMRNLRTDSKSPVSVYGLQLTIAPDRPYGSRLVSAVFADGTAIDEKREYEIVTDGGIAEGMMGFDFSKGTKKVYFEDTLQELIESEIQRRGTLQLVQPKNITVLQEGETWR